MIYNGELYNTTELRSELESRGVSLQTQGDTEVLYELLMQPDAASLLARVDGMFAFALVKPGGELTYGRDRFGIKPLFEAFDDSNRLIALSSEIRCLRSAGLLNSVDPVAVSSAAMFLWVPPPATGWTNVRHVESGTVTKRLAPNFEVPEPVWRAAQPRSSPGISAAVTECVTRQVRSDVPVGLLLSGGLDSTWLAYEVSRLGIDMPFYSARNKLQIATAEPFEEDSGYAQRVAELLGREINWVDLDGSLLNVLPDMVEFMESPFGDPAALTLWQLSKAASKDVKVLLSGVGVEELFLGYERYRAILALSRVPGFLRKLRLPDSLVPGRYKERFTKLGRMARLPVGDWSWASQSYYEQREWDRLSPRVSLGEVVTGHRRLAAESLAAGCSPLAAAANVDRNLFLSGLNLAYADRASMQASVELRVPFLGEPAVAAALGLSAASHVGLSEGKRAFRRAAAAAGVPPFVLKRTKTGFGAPVRSIMRLYSSEVWDRIGDGAIFQDLFDRATAEQLFKAHGVGARELGLPLFGLTSLALWWEQHVAGSPALADSMRKMPT